MPGHLGLGGIDGGAPACQIRKTAISTPIIYVLYVASATIVGILSELVGNTKGRSGSPFAHA